MIDVLCTCGKRYKIPDTLAGKTLRCRQCQASITAPAAPSVQPAAASDPYELAGGPSPEPVVRTAPLGQSAGRQRLGGVSPRFRASNPGRLNVSLSRYYMAYPTVPIMVLVIAGAGVVGLLVGGKNRTGGAVLLGAALLTIFKHIMRLRTKFQVGDVCAAIVLPRNRIAVWTNLSATGSYKPVIKILKAPLGRAAGGAPSPGTRIPAVAIYQGPRRSDGTWWDFYPEPVACATNDLDAIAAAQASIAAEDWSELDAAMKALGENPRSGLHRL